MPVSAEDYVTAIRSVLDRVIDGELPTVRQAAQVIASAVRDGGVIQAFGTGHSEALAMELAGRAGGLVPTNRIALRDLVIYGEAAPEVLSDPLLERDPAIAQRLYDLAAPDPRDVFVIASNSGINGAIVEFALLVKQHGHYLVAISSGAHVRESAPRHPSRKRLSEVADVVLDNGAPYGDAVLPMDGGGFACAVSSIGAALLAQLLTAETVRNIQESGERPPVYFSANVPGGHEHNQTLESQYAGRIRRTAS